MRCMQLALLSLALVGAMAGHAAGGNPFGLNENHPYGVISDAYATPHVAWAKPYAGGAIKALVMAPMWSQRETVELAERLSLSYTAWMSETFSEMNSPAASDPAFSFFQPPPAVVHEHLRQCAAGSYDVIVVGKLDWAMLPGRQRLQLLEKVAAGAGLVYVCPPADNKELGIVFGGKAAPEGRAFIADALPLAALPAFKGTTPEQVVTTSLFGQGRVVVLRYAEKMPKYTTAWPCLTPQWGEPAASYGTDQSYSEEYHKPAGYVRPGDCPEMEFVPYEYTQALVARAVIWAGQKETPARLSRLALAPVVDYPAAARRAQVTTTGAPAGAMLRAVVRSRSEVERVVSIPPQPAQAEAQVALPDLPAGDWFLDVWLANAAGQALDWASARFAVQADVSISAITLAGQGFNPGDTVTGKITLSRPLAAGETLRVELWDNVGRKLQEQAAAAAGASAQFALVVPRPLTIMHSVRARVVRDGRTVCARREDFPVRANLKRQTGFKEIVWSAAGNSPITQLMLRKLANQDQADAIDVGFSGATHARNLAAANLAALPYTTGFGHFGAKIAQPHHAQYPHGGCMTDPVTHKAVDDWFGKFGAIWGPYGPLGWSHGDESYYAANPDTCWSETCLAFLRERLKTRYADLAALNRDWGTTYADWSAVLPLTYDEAKATGNFAPWIEHRLAAGLVWARLYQRTGTAMAATDPGAVVGFDGGSRLWNPNSGMNWWVLKDHVGIMQDYLGSAESMEIIRSFATPRHLTGVWYGTYGLTWDIGPNTVPAHHFHPWYSAFHGLNSTWMWTHGAPGPLSGYAPDLTNLPFFAASRQSLKEIRLGVFDLLHTGRRANDGIAIHYSEVSRLADSLYGTDKRATAWDEALTDFNHALEDCGLQYQYVAYEQIEQGALQQGGTRVLIMPRSRAVSEQEAAAIRRFVQGGGVVIADLVPGVLDGHGAKREPGMLADLFPRAEPGTVTTIGKGKAVLLGDKLTGYAAAAHRTHGGWRKLQGRWRVLGDLLKQHAALTPSVTVTHRQPGDMPPTEVHRFVAGGAEFVGLLRKYAYLDHAAYPVTARFADKRHVYDVRAGKYLGLTDTLNTDLTYEAQLYARLPYKVQGVTAATPAKGVRGTGSVVKLAVQATAGKPGAGHVFDVRVWAPGGRELTWYRRQVAAANGAATVTIPWALNEASGKYAVVVRELASGQTGRAEVTLP